MYLIHVSVLDVHVTILHCSPEPAQDTNHLCAVAEEDEICKATERDIDSRELHEEPTEEAGLGEVEVKRSPNRMRGLWRTAANRTIKESNEDISKRVWKYPSASKQKEPLASESYEEDSYHQVWRPNKQPRLADLVASLGKMQAKPKRKHEALHQTPSTTVANASLRSRQQMLQDRIKVTQEVLTDEILSDERVKKPKMSFKEASKRITLKLQMQQHEKKGCKNISDVVSLYLAKKKAEEMAITSSPAAARAGDEATTSKSFQTHHGKAKLHKRRSNRTFDNNPLGAIPLDKWHKLVSDNKTSVSSINGGFKLETEL